MQRHNSSPLWGSPSVSCPGLSSVFDHRWCQHLNHQMIPLSDLACMGGSHYSFAAFTILKANTSISHAIGFSALLGAGSGILCGMRLIACLFFLLTRLQQYCTFRSLRHWTTLKMDMLWHFLQHSFTDIWGISIGATILQNQLGKCLPKEFPPQLPSGASGAGFVYSIIPEIKNMVEPLKNQVREAFGRNIAVI